MSIIDFFIGKPKPRVDFNLLKKEYDKVFLNETNFVSIAERAIERNDTAFAMEIYDKFYVRNFWNK